MSPGSPSTPRGSSPAEPPCRSPTAVAAAAAVAMSPAPPAPSAPSRPLGLCHQGPALRSPRGDPGEPPPRLNQRRQHQRRALRQDRRSHRQHGSRHGHRGSRHQCNGRQQLSGAKGPPLSARHGCAARGWQNLPDRRRQRLGHEHFRTSSRRHLPRRQLRLGPQCPGRDQLENPTARQRWPPCRAVARSVWNGEVADLDRGNDSVTAIDGAAAELVTVDPASFDVPAVKRHLAVTEPSNRIHH